MGAPINKLEVEYNSNVQRLQVIHNQVSTLMQEADDLKKKNEHLTYCLTILGKEIQSSKPESQKKSIRADLFDLIKAGETITIDDAWNRATANGISTTKATINTALHTLAIEGLMEKPSKGLYRKPE